MEYGVSKIIWKLVLYATCCKLWLERNNRVFKNKSNLVEEIYEFIVWNVSEWASLKKEFDGVLLDVLNSSWAVVLKGGWRAKAAHKSSWIHPLEGILKLNIDGSVFAKCSNRSYWRCY